MVTDSDQLDDIFSDVAVKNARPVRKFQPKAKFKPPRKNSAAPSVSSSTAIQRSDNAPSKLTDPVKTAEPSDNYDSRSVSLSDEIDSSKDMGKANASLHPNLDIVTEEHEKWQAHTEKSAGENADIFTRLEALDDLVPQGTSTDMEGAVPPSDAVSVNVSNSENNVPEVPTRPEVLEKGDPITASRCEGGVSMNGKECEREEMSVMDSIDFSKLTTGPVRRTGKFKPKRKVQMRKEVSVVSSLESGPNPPEINSTEKDSVPDFVDDDDVLDLSSIGLTDDAATEETSEPPLNEESMNLMEGVPEFPAKLVSRRAKIGTSEAHVTPDLSMQQQNACSSGQENETDRVLRPRKNKISFCELDEEDVEISEFSDKDNAASYAAEEEEEDNYDGEQLEQESESNARKTSRKSRKPDEDKEKPSKKRKAKEASDAKPKKFSRSTQRRQVDKALLETPEDEIDYQNVPLRDLIRLAEHKEKQMKKEEAAAKPATKQSTGNSSVHHYENETFTSREEEEENNYGQENPTVQDRNYFNYQTYMDRTPTIRWSKQDTELLYEAVRQFGTDLSMIQHLFPGRTRHQIKLKYKKEEKQNPFGLHDALTTHTKDVSHFKKVIDRLKQIAAEEKQNADEDESMDLPGDEVAEEETSLANDEEAKNEDVPQDVVQETGNPEEKSYDSEDDMLFWSQYKSDT